MSERCFMCEGSGFIGPKNKPGTPIELMQIGCCNCPSCGGTGKNPQLSMISTLDEQLEKLIDERNDFEKEVIRLTKENESLKRKLKGYEDDTSRDISVSNGD